MTYSISNITRTKTRNPMVRFNVTIADEVETEDSETLYGCLAGNNAHGLWAWPPKDPSKRFAPIKWSKVREHNVLRALQAAGGLKGFDGNQEL